MNKKVKSVYFNTSDPWEYDIYAYSQQYPNFSKFVKKLIQNHMDGINPNQTFHQQDEGINQLDYAVANPIDANLIKNFL